MVAAADKTAKKPERLTPDRIKYDAAGLAPAVIQDHLTGAVLMVGYMNREALERTLDGGKVWFWSRSRQVFWLKGESSGNYFTVREIFCDCDADTLLIKVELNKGGVACHTGSYSCFFYRLEAGAGLKHGEVDGVD